MRLVLICALTLALPAGAEDTHGTLNPPEMGMDRVMQNIRRGQADMTTCAAGYHFTKKGDHGEAREIFELCAEKGGYTAAMTWMGQLDNNGLGDEYDPDAAAAWDKRAAEAGDPVGQFNYGLSLLRGHGVARDVIAGKRFVDKAAAAGLPIAKRLQASGYDPDEVTPDADNWKYAPLF
ncbi:MAG: sel1 repeat family protein [Pseudomonadota bacterium]